MTNTLSNPELTALLERLERLPPLRSGFDPTRRGDEMCIMETVAFIAGEKPITDMPACVSEDLRLFSIAWNDGINGNETRTRLLRPFVPELLTSARSDYARKQRTFIALDWLLRVLTPTWLRAVGLVEAASAFQGLERIDDAQDLQMLTRLLANAAGEIEQLREQAFSPPRALDHFSLEAETWQRAVEVVEDNVREADAPTARVAADSLIRENLPMAPNAIIDIDMLPLIGHIAIYSAHTIALRATTTIVRAADDTTRGGVFNMLETAARESLAPLTKLLQKSSVDLYHALCTVPDAPEQAGIS